MNFLTVKKYTVTILTKNFSIFLILLYVSCHEACGLDIWIITLWLPKTLQPVSLLFCCRANNRVQTWSGKNFGLFSSEKGNWRKVNFNLSLKDQETSLDLKNHWKMNPEAEEFGHGAVVSLKLTDFMQFNYVEFYPGATLNGKLH